MHANGSLVQSVPSARLEMASLGNLPVNVKSSREDGHSAMRFDRPLLFRADCIYVDVVGDFLTVDARC